MIGAYNISKAADFQLARNLAAEFGPRQVRVNCIAPGLIRTDFARALWENPETLKMVTMHTPMQRIGEPHEIAGAAVFLASPASTFMTGQAIVGCDGAGYATRSGARAIWIPTRRQSWLDRQGRDRHRGGVGDRQGERRLCSRARARP